MWYFMHGYYAKLFVVLVMYVSVNVRGREEEKMRFVHWYHMVLQGRRNRLLHLFCVVVRGKRSRLLWTSLT